MLASVFHLESILIGSKTIHTLRNWLHLLCTESSLMIPILVISNIGIISIFMDSKNRIDLLMKKKKGFLCLFVRQFGVIHQYSNKITTTLILKIIIIIFTTVK